MFKYLFKSTPTPIAGKRPHCSSAPNLEEPSRRIEALTKIPSSIVMLARPKNAIILSSGLTFEFAPIKPAFNKS